MINRSEAPEIQQIQHIEYPKAEKALLKNRLPVFYIHAASQEVVKIDFVFGAGTWQQNEKFTASMTSFMLQEGTENYTSAQVAGIFDFYGAYIQAGADQDFATLSIICLNKYLPEILKVTEEVLKKPLFPQHELEVLIEKQKQKFKFENEKVKVLCHKKFTTVLFGENHPYAVNNRVEDFDFITREKLVAFFNRWYHAGNCRIIVAGNADEAVRELIEKHFGGTDWMAVNSPVIRDDALPSSDRFHKMMKANALQSAIRIGKPWVQKSHPDYIGLSVLITIFGGYFGSRLMMNIREEKGFTYGISAFVSNLKNAAFLVISTEVDNSYTEATIAEIEKEIICLRNELVSVEELNTVKSYLLGEFLRDFDGPFALANSFKAINDFDLDYDFYDRYLLVLNEITPSEIRQLAQKYLSFEEMYTVVVGENENMK